MNQKAKQLPTGIFDKPWKVTVWLYLIQLFFTRIVISLFRFIYSSEQLLGIWDFMVVLKSIIFALSVLLTGWLYVDSMKKPIDSQMKLRVALYISLATISMSLFFLFLMGSVFEQFFGGPLEIVIDTAISFAVVYILLPIPNRLLLKNPAKPNGFKQAKQR